MILRAMIVRMRMGIVTWVCSRVRPRIQRICPARGFLSASGSYFSSPRLIAPISSGWPRPHLLLKNMKPILHHSVRLHSFFHYFSSGWLLQSTAHQPLVSLLTVDSRVTVSNFSTNIFFSLLFVFFLLHNN